MVRSNASDAKASESPNAGAIAAGSTALLVASGVYIASSLIANIASLRIVMLLGWSVDAGTLIYPLTFTLRDVVHKTGGAKAARVTIVVAAAMNLLMAATFKIVSVMAADPSVGPQTGWSDVLAPAWRIVAASIIAQVVAELCDTETYRVWVRRFGHKLQFGRVLASNTVSVPLDSALFTVVAFVGLMPVSVLWQIFWSNVAIKGVTSLATFPLIYSVRDRALSEELRPAE